MLSPDFIAKIKACGVRRMAERYTELRAINDHQWVGRCPNPEHEDSTASFVVELNDDGLESWRCHGCHSGRKDGTENFGSDNIAFAEWITFHKEHKVLGFYNAVAKAAEFYGIPMEENKYGPIYRQNRVLMERYEAGLTPYVRAYLHQRGLDDEDIRKWHLGFTGERISFPILNTAGDVIGFSNRAFSEESRSSGRKYINTANSRPGHPTGFFKSSVMYGAQFLDMSVKDIYIFEGQFDAILAGKVGVPNAVAVMTCHLTGEQAKFIAKHNFTPTLCFDPDDAGRKGAMRAMETLHDAGIDNARVLFLPDARDMADFCRDKGKEAYAYVMGHSMPFFQYIIKEACDRFDTKVLELQAEMMPEVEKALERVQDDKMKTIAQLYVKKRFMKMWAA